MDRSTQSSQGYVLALFSGVFSGLTIFLGKCSTGSLSSIVQVLFLSLFAFIFAYAWHVLKHGFAFPKLDQKSTVLMLAQVLCSALAIWTFWEAMRSERTGIAVFAVRLELVVALLISVIFLGERLDRWGIAGSVLIFLGALAMSLSPNLMNSSELLFDWSYGLMMALISGLFFGVSEVLAKILALRIPVFSFLIWRGFGVTLVYVIAAAYMGVLDSVFDISRRDFLLVGVASFLGPVCSRILFMKSLQQIGLGFAYLLCQIEPVVATALSYFVLHEHMKINETMASGMILMGCAVLGIPSIKRRLIRKIPSTL